MNPSPRNNSNSDIDIPNFKRHQTAEQNAKQSTKNPRPAAASTAEKIAPRKENYDYEDNIIAVKKVNVRNLDKNRGRHRGGKSRAAESLKRFDGNSSSANLQNSPLENTVTVSREQIKRSIEKSNHGKMSVSGGSAASKIDESASNGKRKITAGLVIRRTLLCIFTALAVTIGSLYALLFSIAHGPSPTVRDLLVLSALQASATKWVPGLFLPQQTVDEIWNASQEVTVDVIPAGDYGSDDNNPNNPTEDEWEKAQDGMIYKTISGPTYKAYVLLVRDPSRVYVATSCDFSKEDRFGLRIFDIADREGAVAVINAGEYVDNGFSLGDTPIGLTYSKGEMVWNDYIPRTFIGFDENNRLIVKNSITQAEADALGIRDAVSFQWGNLLIEQDGDNIKLHYADSNTGAAQRTAIGQRADGTVIMVVTDGRTASSIGATRNDIIDIMVSYGAVSAGMLDGGSSAMMFYRDWYNKYKVDTASLDQYQLKGIVNRYKAFTNPRTMPTYFAVTPLK